MSDYDYVAKELIRYYPDLASEEDDKDFREIVFSKLDEFKKQMLDCQEWVLIELMDCETMQIKLVWRKKQ